MRAQRDEESGRARGRRRTTVLVWLGVVLSVVTAVLVVLRGRRPALPASVDGSRPEPAPVATPVATSDATPVATPVATRSSVEAAEGAPAPGARPSPRHRAAPSPAVEPPAEATVGPGPQPPVEPTAQPVAQPVPGSQGHPVPAPTRRPPATAGAGLTQLVRVSGLGRRSAEALVAAGITSLADLAATDPAALGAALDAAGVKRAATLTSWPQQAAKLLEAGHPA